MDGRVAAFAYTLGARVRRLVESPPGQLAPLDALRALAITMVFAAHYAGEFGEHGPHGLPDGFVGALELGWSGVDLFFVLSGLLIGRQLWNELRIAGTIDVPRFLLRRGLRIWPLYFAFVAGIWLARPWLTLEDVWPDLVFLSNYVTAEVPGGWSLSTEEQFYVVVPLLLLALVKGAGHRGAAGALVALLALLPVSRWLTLASAGALDAPQERVTELIYTPIHTHADALVVGVLLAWLWVHGSETWRQPSRVRIAVVVGVAAAIAFGLRALDKDLFAFTALALLFGVATWFGLASRTLAPWLARPRVFAIVSRLAYGTYLNHLFVLRGVGSDAIRAFEPLGTWPAFACGFVVTFALSLGCAALTFVFVEQPFLDLRDRVLARRTPAQRGSRRNAGGAFGSVVDERAHGPGG